MGPPSPPPPGLLPPRPGFTVKNCADVEGNDGGVTRGRETVLTASSVVPSGDVLNMALEPEAAAETAPAAAAAAGAEPSVKIHVSRMAVVSAPVATSPPPFAVAFALSPSLRLMVERRVELLSLCVFG